MHQKVVGDIKMKDEFKKKFQDDDFLYKEVIRIKKNLMKDHEEFEYPDQAEKAASILLAFPYSGKDELSEDEIIRYSTEIINSFNEYRISLN